RAARRSASSSRTRSPRFAGSAMLPEPVKRDVTTDSNAAGGPRDPDHAMDDEDRAYLAPLFLGPSGENGAFMETLLTGFLRDHVYWRRNFHPEDAPSIPAAMQFRPDFIAANARLEQALFELGADLKQSAPFFAPRYIGHMTS